MQYHAVQPVPLLFDLNVVIANLNKLPKSDALDLLCSIRQSIQASTEANKAYLTEYADITLVGRTIIEQQGLVYQTLLQWLDDFQAQFEKSETYEKLPDNSI